MRDKIASSVVGTPGLDTSPGKIGEALSSATGAVADAGMNIAIQRRQELDTAEANQLMTQYKMNVVNNLEQLKLKYAGNPEKAQDELMSTMKDSLASATNQASNIRVKLMVGRGDGYFDGIMVRQQQAWALSQRDRLDMQGFVEGANSIAQQANKVTSDDSQPYVAQKAALLPLFSALGNVSAGAHAQLSPASAQAFEQKTAESSMKGAIYGWLNSNPAKAAQFLNEPDVKKMIAPKDWSDLNEAATKKLENLPKQMQWAQVRAQLVDSPKTTQDVLSGKTDWNQLNMAPPSPLVDELKKLALNGSTPAAQIRNEQEMEQARQNFFDEAHRLGIGVRGSPPERSVADLVKFQIDLVRAANNGFITKSELATYTRQLMKPMSDAIIKAHDPNFWTQYVTNNLTHMVGQKVAPQDMVDRYTGGYDVINRYLKSKGQESNVGLKSQIIGRYLNAWDHADEHQSLDEAGRPYNPQTMAQAVLGLKKGGTMETKLGRLSIDYFDENGQPGHNFTKDEQDRFNHLKQLTP